MAKENKKEFEEEYEPEIVDLDGEPFEIIYGVTFKDDNYLALVPYTEDLDDEEDTTEFIILKEIEEDGEVLLASIEDDDLYNEVGELFIKEFEKIFAEEE